MKKLFVLVGILLIMSACSNTPSPAKNFKPSEFLSLEDAKNHLSYEPLAIEKDNTITYKSANAGQEDIIRVELIQKEIETDTEKIKAEFDNVRQKNQEYESLISTDDLGADSFISIPSIHLYKNGYYLKITAGSGGNENQITLLKDLGKIALENMEEKIPKK